MSAPQYPPSPAYPGYPAYPPGAPYGYPPYSGYGGYGPPQLASTEPPRRGRWFVPIFAIVLIALTIGAVALAALGPSTVKPLSPPSGWNQVFSGPLTNQTGDWDISNGCEFNHQGLVAEMGAVCAYKPSLAGDVVSKGFYFSVTIAPAAAVPQEGQAAIGIGNTLWMCVSQDGSYILSDAACGTAPDSTEAPDQGGVASLHTDALVPNTLSMLYDAQASTVTYAVNGQPLETVKVVTGSGGATLSLGTGANGGAIFTAATLYTAPGLTDLSPYPLPLWTLTT